MKRVRRLIDVAPPKAPEPEPVAQDDARTIAHLIAELRRQHVHALLLRFLFQTLNQFYGMGRRARYVVQLPGEGPTELSHDEVHAIQRELAYAARAARRRFRELQLVSPSSASEPAFGTTRVLGWDPEDEKVPFNDELDRRGFGEVIDREEEGNIAARGTPIRRATTSATST